MEKYVVHIFDVDDVGCIIGNTEKFRTIYSGNDDEACKMAELIRQDFNKTEPLPENVEWGKVEWCMHLLKDDEVII